MQRPEKLIEAIHQTPQMLVFEFAGAGSQALAWLHSIGGSSRTILEATDRYTAASLVEAIGFEPEQFVSRRVAEAMATQAYLRADHLARPGTPVVGVGCTATIATDRLKRGEHSGYVAAYDGKRRVSYGLALAKGTRSRQEEETLISLLVIHLVAEMCGLEIEALPLTAGAGVEALAGSPPKGSTPSALDATISSITGQEALQKQVETLDLLDQLMRGEIEWVLVEPDGRMRSGQAPSKPVLLSGSFNPLHEGHRQLLEVAGRMVRREGYFELPVVNADKAPLDPAEARRRLAQFAGFAPVILTRAPLFSQKALLFPGAVFILGVDTAERLIQPRFYNDDPGQMFASFEQIRLAGGCFLVAGRVKDDHFFTLQDLSLPAGYRELFRAIPETVFRVDVSSTALRQAQISSEVD